MLRTKEAEMVSYTDRDTQTGGTLSAIGSLVTHTSQTNLYANNDPRTHSFYQFFIYFRLKSPGGGHSMEWGVGVMANYGVGVSFTKQNWSRAFMNRC